MFKNPCAHRKVFFIISIVLIAVSVISMAFRGFNLGIDFTGGTTLEIRSLPEGFVYSEQLEKDMDAIIAKSNPEVKTQKQRVADIDGEGEGIFMRTNLTDEQLSAVTSDVVAYFNGTPIEEILKAETIVAPGAEGENATEMSTDASVVVEEVLPTEVSTEVVADTEVDTPESAETSTEAVVETKAFTAGDIEIEKVTGTTSTRLITDTFKAVLLAIVLMLIYIAIRFDFKSGLCAVMALAHDVVLMFGFYSLFHFTMNTSFVAAVLTIIGYSINATIVVFDRVRENNKLMRQASADEKADKAIKTSYTRTLYSSLTTLFTIGALYILGVPSIQEFALPIIVGIVCGAYSSLFVAPTFWAFWKEKEEAKK